MKFYPYNNGRGGGALFMLKVGGGGRMKGFEVVLTWV